MTKRLVISANTAWYLVNFRLNLARAMQVAGYEVVAIAPPGKEARELEAAGIRFIPTPMDNKGTNPVKDLTLLLRLFRILRRERPVVFLGYTVKPNVYGGIACRLLGISSVHNIAGLGTAFIEDTWLTRVVQTLYRYGMKAAGKVFFQNPDDLELFLRLKVVQAEVTELLPGSGVDTDWFYPIESRVDQVRTTFRFLLSARLLWDKGIAEYVDAARQIIAEHKNVEFQLLGFLGADNRTAISRRMIDQWEREGTVRYIGSINDVRPVIAEADCVVLPSYREGTPRSLLEAASMGKPVITTNAVGCREAVDDGITGYLCRPRDAEDLADKMRQMVGLEPAARTSMGKRGREKMVQWFDERIVIDRYLKVVGALVGERSVGAESD